MSIGAQVARSAGWTLAMRLSTRLIGLASTLVLARLLAPSDFGLIAMGTSVAAALEAATAVGLEWAIIQKQTRSRDYLDSAWTLNILIGVLKALLLLALIAPITALYHEPRVAVVMGVLALTAFIDGGRNIGVALHEQDMRFKRIFATALCAKLAAFAVTLSLAFYWQSFWALVAGMLTRSVVDVALSYALFAYRPRIAFSRCKEFFHFSKWIAANSVLFFLTQRGTDFIIGNRSGPGALGAYAIAFEIASLPTTELTHPLMRAVYPGYSRLQGDKQRLGDGFIAVFQLVAAVALPATVGMVCLADLLVNVLLGAKWQSVLPLMAPLAVYGAIRALQATFGTTFMSLGLQHLSAKIMALYILLAFPLFALLLSHYTLAIAAWGLTAVYGLMGLLNILVARRHLALSGLRIAGALLRPFAAAALMGAALVGMRYALGPQNGLTEELMVLLALTSAGVVIYGLALFSLWQCSGRPDGAEARVLRLASGLLRQSRTAS